MTRKVVVVRGNCESTKQRALLRKRKPLSIMLGSSSWR